MDPGEIDIELRTPDEIRARILTLSAILRRLALETPPQDGKGDPLADAFDEREWLRDLGLQHQVTAREATLLDSPIGAIAAEAIPEVSWHGEALVALAWAVGIRDMPRVDAASDPDPIMDHVPRPWDVIDAWMSESAIVSESDAARHREFAEIWHWRAATEVLLREASATDRRDYMVAIAEVAAEALAAGIVPALRGRDFPVRGRSFNELSDTEVDELVAVTGQRLRALNWLCGFGKSWDDVPLDV